MYDGNLTRRRPAEGGFHVRAVLPAGGSAVIRVVVADDQALVRSGFAMILAAEPGIEVVAEAADGAEALAAAGTHRPDVVLMDIRMPGMDGIEATRHITTQSVDGGRARARAHDLRRGRLRRRGAAGGGERLRAEGHRARRARPRRDGRRRRRRPAGARR